MRLAPLTAVLILALFGCGGGASTASNPRPDAAGGSDAAPPPPEGDAGALKTPGAACAETAECADGLCLHGLCSLSCVTDAACGEGQVCVARGAGRFCTPRCAATADCADGQLCVALSPGAGFCVGRGPGAPGETCADAADCASWQCAGGRCLQDCLASPECPPGQVCMPLHVGGVCAAAGAGALEAPCDVGADCASGICRGGGCTVACVPDVEPDGCPNDRHCVAYATLSLCERACGRPEDCGVGGLCLPAGDTPLCLTRGTGAVGDACEAPQACQSGHCALGQCRADCAAGCAQATACVHDVTGSTCRPAGAQPENAPCLHGEECRSGFCAAGRCGQDCEVAPDCPAGMVCTDFESGRFCFPTCRGDDDCEAAAYCAGGLGPAPICFWRGAGADGAACLKDFECRSGLCGGGRCLAPCVGGGCSGGQRCRDFGRAAFCTALPAPLGAECYGDAECATGLLCTAGRCLPECAAGCPAGASCGDPPVDGRCHPTCGRAADCRPGAVCQRHDGASPLCESPGVVPLQGPCVHGRDCESGLCHRGVCRADCPGCADGAGAVADGAPCGADAECRSDLCVGHICARTCPETGCPAGDACVFLEDARICAVGCTVESIPCPAGRACVPVAGVSICRGPRAGLAEGVACAVDADCAGEAPVCQDGVCRVVCELRASAEAPHCPAGRVCRARPDGVAVCLVPGEAPPMTACATGADCADGLCDGGRCYRSCRGGCPAADGCVDASRGLSPAADRCAPVCLVPADCPAGLGCRFDAAGRGHCY